MTIWRAVAGCALLSLGLTQPGAARAGVQSAPAALAVSDFYVTTVDAVRIFVREVRPAQDPAGEPLILLHGARAPGIASFDLPVKDASLARTLAERTHRSVYVMDARGYGLSDRPAAMAASPAGHPPLSRAYEVVRDIDAVAAAARVRSSSKQVSLLGWATGGMWAAYYASLHPEQVSHLVTMNALYGAAVPHAQFGAGSSLSDPRQPDQFNPAIGAYGVFEGASLLNVWDRSLPPADRNRWRDPDVAAALVRATLDSDSAFARQEPGKFRAPSGALEDSFYQAVGRRLFDASSIRAHILVVRSERDFWSRPEDVTAFLHDAHHAASARALTLPNATHFVHLERPEHGREQLVDAVADFLEK
jgi:pimeloyl-ACP methyl ester carboxylesterase